MVPPERTAGALHASIGYRFAVAVRIALRRRRNFRFDRGSSGTAEDILTRLGGDDFVVLRFRNH